METEIAFKITDKQLQKLLLFIRKNPDHFFSLAWDHRAGG